MRLSTDDTPTGLLWWDELTQSEREMALERATTAFGRAVTVVEAFAYWITGAICSEGKILDLREEFKRLRTQNALDALRAQSDRPLYIVLRNVEEQPNDEIP
jgi:hypothetical protein